MSKVLRVLGMAGVLGAAVALGFAGPASAHNFYVSSTPSANEVLTTLPEEFVVTTSDKLLELGGSSGGFVMEVVGPDGLYYGDGCITVDGPSVSMAAALGPAGDYTLNWQVVSADGHSVSGEVPFSWAPTDTREPTAGAAKPPVCGEPVVTPSASASPESSPAATPPVAEGPGSDNSASDNAGTDALWIGGGVVAVAIAVLATLLLLKPRKKP